MTALVVSGRRIVSIASLCLSIATGCSLFSRSEPVAFSENEWTSPGGQKGIEVVTPHYDLRITSRDTLMTGYLPEFMEKAYNGYATTIQPSRESADRMVVYLFATRNEWADFTKATFPAQADTYLHLHAGGYTDQATAMAVAHDLGRDRTLALLAHEGFHQYAARYLDRPLPSWLGEGLACQWEAFKLDHGMPTFTPMENYLRRNSLRGALTSKDGFIPLPKLLSMNAGQAVRETGLAVRSYYSQVWILVLFLQKGAHGKYAKPFAAMLADAGTDRFDAAVGAYRATTPDSGKLNEAEIVFRHYITDDLDTCSREFLEFARQAVY
jgi:hypothetical protein